MTAKPTSRGVVVVDLGPEANPIDLTPAIMRLERFRLGCAELPDKTWRLSWKFRREYLRDYEAMTGQRVFEDEPLAMQTPNLQNPLYRMDIQMFTLEEDKVEWRLVRKDNGRLLVYAEPDAQPPTMPPGAERVIRNCGIGMDVSEGVGNSDSTIEVFFADNMEQAAELADNRISPPELGRFAAAVGRWYNDAVVCCVRKLHGLTTLRTMVDEANYSNLWHHRLAQNTYEKETKKLGWATGEMSSALLIDPWNDTISNGKCIIRSQKTLDQHRLYIYNERGEITYQPVAHLSPEVRDRHGDTVVGCALARRACQEMHFFKSVVQARMSPAMRMLQDKANRVKKGPWIR